MGFDYDILKTRQYWKQEELLYDIWKEHPDILAESIDFAIKNEAESFIPFWYLDHFFYKHEAFYKQWEDVWIWSLEKLSNSSCKRSVLRVLTKKKRNFNEEQAGFLLDFCIRHFSNPFEEIAVVAHCMKITEYLLPRYPELAREVQLILEDLPPKDSAGVRLRTKQLLQVVNRL
ncbi:MAG: hypothetical protein N4A45_04565 [Flavobacteriales bacterium]|jgi:hypothetical protein|nr:hypothetical protein [Flavobacteriales bacterium]